MEEKFNITDDKLRFINVVESRLNKLILDEKNYSNSFNGIVTPTYTPMAKIYYHSLSTRINELELIINEMKNII